MIKKHTQHYLSYRDDQGGHFSIQIDSRRSIIMIFLEKPEKARENEIDHEIMALRNEVNITLALRQRNWR